MNHGHHAAPQIRAPQAAHRMVENIGFLGGALVAVLYGTAEAAQQAGLLQNPAHSRGIPWGLVIIVGALVLPKTLGRATAGKIWQAGVVAALKRRLSSAHPKQGD